MRRTSRRITSAIASVPLFYWNTTSQVCTGETASTNVTYYGVGADVSAAAVTRTVDALASHRIQLVHYTTPEGLRFRDYSVYDSLKGADCYPTALPDGTIVCLPYGGYVQTYYRDAACTQPVDLIEVSTGAPGCAAPPAPKYARKYITPQAGSCQYNVELHQVVDAVRGHGLHELRHVRGVHADHHEALQHRGRELAQRVRRGDPVDRSVVNVRVATGPGPRRFGSASHARTLRRAASKIRS